MTKQELNRDIKRLYKSFLNKKSGDTRTWTREDWTAFENENEKIQKEFKRLYFADKNLEYITLNSLKMLLVVNNSMRIIPLHTFGIDIKIN